LLNINGSTFSTNLPTLNPVPSNIVLNFSETLRESDAQLIVIKNNNSLKSGSFTPSQDKTQWTFTPSSNFSNGSYGIVFGNQVIDIAGNISSI
jgi:methionine-rich copper-binding protein CopC